MNEVKPDRILQVGCGFMGSKLLFLANEVGIFEQLAGRPATLDELTQRIGCRVERCEYRLMPWLRYACGKPRRRIPQQRGSPQLLE